MSMNGEISTAAALAGKVVGVYFSAHWCPPCRGFTPQLAATYKKLTQEQKKNFEIVFVSLDSSQAGFDEYYNLMPWLGLPWEDRNRKNGLSSKFQVGGIPTLVIIDENGGIITEDGRSKVSADREGENFTWGPRHVPQNKV